jgi:hypothetical protein
MVVRFDLDYPPSWMLNDVLGQLTLYWPNEVGPPLCRFRHQKGCGGRDLRGLWGKRDNVPW